MEKLANKADRQWAKLWARSDAELGGISAADRAAVDAACQALREEMEQYCLVE